MNVVIEDQIWKQVCDNGHKLASSPTWTKFFWKVNLRFFKTPVHAVSLFMPFFLLRYGRKEFKAFNKENCVSVFKYVNLATSINTFVQKKK